MCLIFILRNKKQLNIFDLILLSHYLIHACFVYQFLSYHYMRNYVNYDFDYKHRINLLRIFETRNKGVNIFESFIKCNTCFAYFSFSHFAKLHSSTLLNRVLISRIYYEMIACVEKS